MTKRVALVTGASSGIGKAIAIELAKDGIEVIINFSKSKEKADLVRSEIVSAGGRAFVFQADITKNEDLEKMFNFIEEKYGILDILVNNAGIYLPDFIENHDLGNWDRTLKVNLMAKVVCTKYAIPLLKKSKMPRIVNISSRAAVKPFEESVAYCCSAAGIVMLTQVSAVELSKYSIKVNAVSPGLTRTPLTEVADDEEEFRVYAEKNPSKRLGMPKDVAEVVSFLVSKKADFINGENINVSGGIIQV